MAYTPTVYTNDASSPDLNATNLNKSEQGIKDAHLIAVPVDCSSRVAEYTGDGIPLIPDNVAGRTYFQDEWATTDSWIPSTNGTLSVSSGILKIDCTGGYVRLTRSISILTATVKTVRIVITRLAGTDTSVQLANSGLSSFYSTGVMGAVGVPTLIEFIVNTSWQRTLSELAIYFPSAASGSSYKIDWIYIGTGAYDTPALDRSGNGNSLTLNAVTPVNGKYGKEMSFNGSTSYAQASSPVIGTTGTVAVRFKRGDLARLQRIFSNIDYTSFTGLSMLFQTSNALQVAVGNGSTVTNTTIGTISDLVNFHSCVLMINGTSLGVLLDESYSSYTINVQTASTLSLFIGRSAHATSDFLNGIISHFRYDSRIWTADEARAWSLNPISIDSRV